jgi:hypothetical protein
MGLGDQKKSMGWIKVLFSKMGRSEEKNNCKSEKCLSMFVWRFCELFK